MRSPRLRPDGEKRNYAGSQSVSKICEKQTATPFHHPSEFLCETLPLPDWLYLEPGINTNGTVRFHGFGCRSLLDGLAHFAKLKGGGPQPDYLINHSMPNDGPSGFDQKTWLIGDMTISAKTLYEKYHTPGRRRSQFEAITRQALEYGLRLSVFFTFYGGDSTHWKGLQELMIRESFQDGELVFIISVKGPNKGK